MERRFSESGFPLVQERNVIPLDNTTLFVCSGMQNLKHRFKNPDFTHHGTLQSCVRTNDLELVGDGVHLTYFQMLGNFSFGKGDYEVSVDLWHAILTDLKFPVTHICVHPESPHRPLWERRGYLVKDEPECSWTDGNIGGYCCEVFCDNLEVGNLVNTLGHSTDVGFGWERMVQVFEGKSRIDETSLFRQDLSPVARDHVRTLEVLWDNKVVPGGKGREGVCRHLLRRVYPLLDSDECFVFDRWLDRERFLQDRRSRYIKKMKHKHPDMSPEWFRTTFGFTEEELV